MTLHVFLILLLGWGIGMAIIIAGHIAYHVWWCWRWDKRYHPERR